MSLDSPQQLRAAYALVDSLSPPSMADLEAQALGLDVLAKSFKRCVRVECVFNVKVCFVYELVWLSQRHGCCSEDLRFWRYGTSRY